MEISTHSEYNLSVKTIEHLGKSEKVQTKQNKTKPDGNKSDEVGDLNNNKKNGKATNQKKHPLEKNHFELFIIQCKKNLLFTW
jgi:hypothetical protein